jgi:multicomponent Na+:H+ antiporter subunit C
VIDYLLERGPYLLFVLLAVIGVYLMMAHRNLVKAVVGLYLFQTAAILFFIALSYRTDASVPIAVDGVALHNPLPHAMMLTAIVVGVAILGVAIAILRRIQAEAGTIEERAGPVLVEAAHLLERTGEVTANGLVKGPQSGGAARCVPQVWAVGGLRERGELPVEILSEQMVVVGAREQAGLAGAQPRVPVVEIGRSPHRGYRALPSASTSAKRSRSRGCAAASRTSRVFRSRRPSWLSSSSPPTASRSASTASEPSPTSCRASGSSRGSTWRSRPAGSAERLSLSSPAKIDW